MQRGRQRRRRRRKKGKYKTGAKGKKRKKIGPMIIIESCFSTYVGITKHNKVSMSERRGQQPSRARAKVIALEWRAWENGYTRSEGKKKKRREKEIEIVLPS